MNESQQQALEAIQQLAEDMKAQLGKLQYMITQLGPVDELRVVKQKAAAEGSVGETTSGTVVEGVFDGQNMVGPDGKMYTVPANYASKSKLVEGDVMKLTIKSDGTFIYKQIGPVARARQVATLVRDDSTGMYRAVTGAGRSYRLVTASVTYYKGEAGDAVVILVPKETPSRWAAVENIVKGSSEEQVAQEIGGNDELNFADAVLDPTAGVNDMSDDQWSSPEDFYGDSEERQGS